MSESYNGWKNRSTWNVSLWINNDEALYRNACDFMWNFYKVEHPYSSYIRWCGLENEKTPDGIRYISNRLDYRELDNMMFELVD